MKLQQKTALVFAGLLIVLLVVVSIFASIVILSSYADLEQQYIEQDLQQAVIRIDDEGATLSAIVSDWGPWDDSYDFVQGSKPDFVRANLAPETYTNLRLNVILFINRSGSIIYAGGYNSSSGSMAPVPEDLVARLGPDNPLMDLSDPRKITRGIILLSQNPMIIASRPVVRTDFSGDPQGVVIMGRFLDAAEVGRLAELTRPSLRFYRTDDPGLSAEVYPGLREQEMPGARIIQPVDSNSIEGYTLVRDIYGKDALVLGITEPRSIYQQGMSTTLKFIGIILLSGLVFGLFVMVLLDKYVLSRLGKLVLQVHGIGDRSGTSDRVEIGGDDEFDGLAGEINRMLDTIDAVRLKAQLSETRFRELAGLLPQIIFEMDLNGNMWYVNNAGSGQFGITREKIEKGVNIQAFLSPENIEQMKRGLVTVLGGAPSRRGLFVTPAGRDGHEGYRLHVPHQKGRDSHRLPRDCGGHHGTDTAE